MEENALASDAIDAPSLSIHDQVSELNRQAVNALLHQIHGVEDLCRQALELSAPKGWEHPVDLPGAAEVLRTMGRLAMAHSDYGRALEHFHRSLRLFEQAGLAHEIVNARAYIGVVYTSLGDYSRAAELLRTALHEAESLCDEVMEAEILNDLSYTYVLAGEPEPALKHLERSIQVFRNIKDDLRLSWALESMGQAYLLVGRKEEALACVLEAVDHSARLHVGLDLVRLKQSAGEMYRAVGDILSAMQVFQEEIQLAREFNLRGEQCSGLFSIADLYQAGGRHAESLPLLLEAIEIAAQTGMKSHLRQCYLLLSHAYKNLGEYAQALEYHERFYEIDRAIFNAETDQRLRNVQALYQLDTARKEAELYQLRAQALQLEIEERRRTEAILARAASTDPLTDLLNRRAFFDLAEKAFADAVQNHTYLSIILIDVDRFKDVNDRFGHLVGDQALALVAGRLRSHLRTGDKIARYGGEEFIILLPGVSPSGALTLADRLRLAVAGEPIQTRGVLVPVTMSLGVASLAVDEPLQSLDHLIGQADQALFMAKNQGRNAVLSYTPGSGTSD